jgi:CRISPR/Cas system-associated endonuclease Cas1
VADRLVWTLVNRGQFSIDDFEQRDLESGMFLRPDAQRRYFEAYERWMLAPGADRGVSFRRLLQKEVENWVKFLRDGVPEAAWSPFCFGFEATREGTGR